NRSPRMGPLGGLLVSAAVVAAMATPSFAATGDTIADTELGQVDFTHNAVNGIDGASLNAPTMVAVDRSSIPNHLYAADFSNSRVLGWNNAASFASGAPADLVIGQPDFASSAANNGGVTASSLNSPSGVAVDSHGNLYVSDFNNNRALEYNAPFAACSSL